MSEAVVQDDSHPGYVGTSCLLSSSFVESGKDLGVVTLPIMSRNGRQTIGKVRGINCTTMHWCYFVWSHLFYTIKLLCIPVAHDVTCSFAACTQNLAL